MRLSPAAPRAASLGQRLIRGSGWAFLSRTLALPVALLQTMLLTRLLAPAEVGTYFLAISLATVAAIVAQAGMGRTVVKHVAAALATERPRAARHAIRLALLVTAIGGVLTGLAVAGPPGHWITRMLEASAGLETALNTIALLLVTLALADLLAEACRGFHDLRAASLFGDQLLQRLILVVSLGLVWTLGAPITMGRVLLIALGAAALAIVIGGFWLRRHLARLGDRGAPWPAFEILRHGPPFVGVRLSFWLLMNADLWLLAMFRPAAEVAIYGAASRIALLAGTPLTIANAALAPAIAELHSRGQRERLEKVVRAAATFAALPSLALVLVLALFGDRLLALLFTDAYRAGYPVLLCLAFGQWLHVGFGSCALSLAMTGHQQDVMIVSMLTAAAAILAFYLVAAPYGALGVALVVVTSLGLYNLVLTLLARKRLGIRTWMTLSVGAFGRYARELRRGVGVSS